MSVLDPNASLSTTPIICSILPCTGLYPSAFFLEPTRLAMKISSSSSLILATLAISSSSSSLAAPTNDAPEVGMTSSSSNHHIASRHGPDVRSVDKEEVADRSMEARGPLEDVGDLVHTIAGIIGGVPVLGPILQAPLEGVADSLNKHPGAASAEQLSVNKQSVATLQKAVDHASDTVKICLPVPQAVHGMEDPETDPSSPSSSDPTTTSDSLSPSATETPPNTPNQGRRQLPGSGQSSALPVPSAKAPAGTPASANAPPLPNASGFVPAAVPDLPAPPILPGSLPTLPVPLPNLPVPLPNLPFPVGLPATPGPPAPAPGSSNA